MTTAPYVAVCGGSECTEEEAGLAEEVGRLLARAGAVILCGGLRGVMDAVAKGAEAERGTTIGILPGLDRKDQSSHLTLSIPTGMGEARNILVVTAADAVIAVAGEFGTLSEVAFALRLGIPVVGLRTWELAKHGGERVDAFPTADTPADAVRLALEAAKRRV